MVQAIKKMARGEHVLIDRNQCVPERWGGVGRSVDKAEEQTGTETGEDGLQNDSLYQESVI